MALFTISSLVARQMIAHRHRFLVTRGRRINQEMGRGKRGYEHVLLIIKLKVCIFIVCTIFIILNKYYFKLINKNQTKDEVCT